MLATCTRTHYSNKTLTLYEQGSDYEIDENDPKNERFFDIPKRAKPGPKPKDREPKE